MLKPVLDPVESETAAGNTETLVVVKWLMAVTELATGCHDSGSAALAHGGGEMPVLEYLLEFFHAGGRRSFEISPGIFVE